MSKAKGYLGDCLEVIKRLPSESIDCVVTSPPYDNLRTYENGAAFDFPSFKNIASEMIRLLKPGACIVWNVADATTKEGSETGSSFRQALYFKDSGLNLHATMIWNKMSTPWHHKNRYPKTHEYVFILSKERPAYVELICDRKNKYAGTKVHGVDRLADGTTATGTRATSGKLVKEYGARFSVWDMPPALSPKDRSGHPAPFPIHFARDHIVTWCPPKGLVLDPFMGSGTTGIAAVNTNRNFIGIERESRNTLALPVTGSRKRCA